MYKILIWINLQFETLGDAAPDLGPDDIVGVWRIDDTDNSFYTQPFRIKYARQDVLLSVMIAFNLSLGKYEVDALYISVIVVLISFLLRPSTEILSRYVTLFKF